METSKVNTFKPDLISQTSAWEKKLENINIKSLKICFVIGMISDLYLIEASSTNF